METVELQSNAGGHPPSFRPSFARSGSCQKGTLLAWRFHSARVPSVEAPLDIRFVSSLTPDDESRLAPQLLNALGGVLDKLPIAYTLRIETTAGRSFSHNHIPPRKPRNLKVETREIAATRK